MFSNKDLADLLELARQKAVKVAHKHGRLISPHEGWALIREEEDELWDEVRKRPRDRDLQRMRDECVDIAAYALLFALDLTMQGGKD